MPARYRRRAGSATDRFAPGPLDGRLPGLLLGLLLAPSGALRPALADLAEPVRVPDARLELRLVAEEPDIVTPIGLAVGPRDRVFAIESHTHLRPADYDGPRRDRIKVFTDSDGDGRADRIEVFAEGLDKAMNLAFSPGGVLHAVCAKGVWALADLDGDGRSEAGEQARIVELRTSEQYPHNCLMSIAFSRAGELFLGRGNVGGRAYTYRGSDGSTLGGYGEGGDVVRARGDGSRLELFATGFWNPFGATFDRAGRLLLVDNDPMARGPNRIVHAVEGGDYGYKALYGGDGNHPFQGWDGTLPGTLPFVSGTGEAPCGLLDASRTALPADLGEAILVTVWNEHAIELHRTKPRGVSLQAERSLLVTGGRDFRPVAIDADSKGNLYFSDWVLVDYPVHGRGRIWRLSIKKEHAREARVPRARWAEPEADPGAARMEALRRVADPREAPRLLDALKSDDPFVRHAARVALGRPPLRERALAATRASDPRVRLGALLALQRAGIERPDPVARRLLGDDDPTVRRMALAWAGEAMLTSLRGDLERAISRPGVDVTLFGAYLAAVECLDPAFVEAVRGRKKVSSRSIPRRLDPNLLGSLARDRARSTAVRALAIQRLEGRAEDRRFLIGLARGRDVAASLRLEALRKLARLRGRDVLSVLAAIALERTSPSGVRAEALVALSRHPFERPETIAALASEPDPAVAREAARALRGRKDSPAARRILEARLAEVRDDPARRALAEELELGLGLRESAAARSGAEGSPRGPPPASEPPASAAPCFPRPTTLEGWQAELRSGGDPEAGRRVFESPYPDCLRCHPLDGIGSRLGPDLSGVARSVGRARILRSILRPSDRYAPQYMMWVVITTDGEAHEGVQLDHKAGGAIDLYTTEERKEHFDASEIAAYEVSRRSLMPDGLEESLTVTDLRDLLAFLESPR